MTENIYISVGKRIREERLKADLTQEQLGEKADIHYSFLGYIERGTKKASVRTLKRIADALCIPLNTLFASIELKPRKSVYSMAHKFDFFLKDRPRKDQEQIFKIFKTFIKKIDKSF